MNTCGFIDAARQESIGVIEELLERKRRGHVKGVIVAGCLAERQREGLLEQFPEVDHVVGVFGREEIAQVADRLLGGLNEQREVFRPAPIQAQDDRARLRITPRHLVVSQGLRGLRPALHVLRDPATCAASTSPSRSRWSSPRPRSWPATASASWCSSRRT